MKRVVVLAAMLICTGCPSFAKKGGTEFTSFPVPADACGRHLAAVHGTETKSVAAALDQEFADYQVLVEQTLSRRAETINFAERLLGKVDNSRPLSGEDLRVMNNGVVYHLALREQLYRIAESHECWLDLPEQSPAQAGLTREARLRGVMLSLSAALVLYDNYLLAISLFEENDKLRRLLNQPDSGYAIRRAELRKVAREYSSARNRSRVRSAIRFYKTEKERVDPSFFNDPQVQYLELLIGQSPSYASTNNISPLSYLGRKINLLESATEDELVGIGKEGVNLLSMVVGNAMGLWRHAGGNCMVAHKWPRS